VKSIRQSSTHCPGSISLPTCTAPAAGGLLLRATGRHHQTGHAAHQLSQHDAGTGGRLLEDYLIKNNPRADLALGVWGEGRDGIQLYLSFPCSNPRCASPA